MRIFLFSCAMFLSATVSFSQTVFFKSEIAFREDDFKDFFSAVKVAEQQVLFMANDYLLHAYNKRTGKTDWEFNLRYKENVPVKLLGNTALAKSGELIFRLDLATGNLLDTLRGFEISTEPILRENVMYASGLYDAGSLFAYDLKTRKIIWNHFVGDGFEFRPYYGKDAIYASMDQTRWLKVSYDGKLMNCRDSASVSDDFISDSCLEEFSFITHDGYKVSEEKLQKMFGESIFSRQVLYSNSYTFVFEQLGTKILVLGKKMKKVALINLGDIIGTPYFDLDRILQVDDRRLSFSLFSEVYTYDFVNRKLLRKTDLSEWEPYSIEMDGEDYWVISRKDGQLYGIR